MATIARWLYDEASSGTTPTTVADTGPATTTPLTIAYHGGAWSSIAAGKGLKGAATLSAFGSGNKIYNAFQGSKVCTIELCLNLGTVPDGYSFPFKWQDVSDVEHVLSIIANDASGTLRIANENSTGALTTNTGAISLSAVHTIHAVWDADNGTSSDQLRLYVDGTRITSLLSYTAPAGATLDLDGNGAGTTCTLAIGDADDTWDITTYYAEMHDVALDSATIASRATSLLANNDTAPGGGAILYALPVMVGSGF